MRHRNKHRTRAERRPDEWSDGYDAAIAHEGIDQNPYKRGTPEHREWSRGWRKAKQ